LTILRKSPRAFFQIGIAEANMIGIAAGLTIEVNPFTGTFANFYRKSMTKFVNQ
jgi:transketolase